jgi:hypothetical protein
MMAENFASQTLEPEIRKLEDLRSRFLINEDFAALEALIADDLVHVHTTGVIDNKSSYLHAVKTRLRFLTIERQSLVVKSFKNFAIMTGPLHQAIQMRNTGQIIETEAIATQVWIKQNRTWVQSNFQSTRVGRSY